jgi:His-Xaa-Ser system radical SAM maturase HxsC
MPLRRNEIFLSTDGNVPDGYRGYAIFDGMSTASSVPTVTLPESMSYLRDGDVIGIELERPGVRVLYRRNSPHNTFLVTERCNHYCLMCSQPPREVDDGWLVDEMLEAIPLISAETGELGFTGGEPTLLGDRFLEVLRTAKSYLPETSLHILTNGRTFADADFAKKYAEIDHADMVAGIPIYSDISTRHDYVVQADGAFDGTIRGILNLKRHRQKVELRVVIHKQTYERLPQLAEFIARNLTMVDHVALMGLEITGFTRANLPALWIDPIEYQDELYRAATTLADNGMHVSIYNHQLCLIDRRLWPFARRSISDWKNEYMPECEGCRVQEQCGGFFSSAFHRYSDHIAAITEEFGLV